MMEIILIMHLLMETYAFEDFIKGVVKEDTVSKAETINKETEEPIRMTESILDGTADDFLQELTQEINLADQSMDVERDHDLDECLSITDIEKDSFKSSNSNLPEQEEIPAAKIIDDVHGKQLWNVRVVGMKQSYIHVYDGSRTWIYCNHSINCRKDDILEVVVTRIGSGTELIECRDIHQVSEDYLIPDEYAQVV